MSSLDPADVRRYQDLFCARVDDYAYWSGWSWLRARSQLTIEVLAAGLVGRPSISSYMTDIDGLTHVLVVDFDTPDGLELARKTALVMWDAGIAAYVEPSRQGRAHLIVTLDGRIPAAVGRRFMRIALLAAGIDSSNPKIELFPASDRGPGPGQVGKCIRAPMMPNPKNDVR